MSSGAYDSLNLGAHVGDDPGRVQENRRRFAAAVGGRPVFLQQVHGVRALELTCATADGEQADACWTRQRQVACTIMVADCLPVLFADMGGRCVAAAHAGWRGLAGLAGEGVIESLWSQWWPNVAGDPAEAARQTTAWLGPCIGPGAFEVGEEVRAAFVSAHPGAAARFQPVRAGKWLADLPGLARDGLGRLGLQRIHGNDGSTGWCTVANPSRFFSHRRDRLSGRFAASIWLE